MRSQLDIADFYLIRLSCSFRPTPEDRYITWARFQVTLLADTTGRQPIAVGLSPQDITQEVKRNITFTIAPTLKFKQVETQIGSYKLILEYPELQPVITSTGVEEYAPSWDYAIAKGMQGIQGAKWMYILVKAPKGMTAAQAILNLEARVKGERTIWAAWSQFFGLRAQKEQRYLKVQLWK
jgi:hypothetical protein